MSTYTPIASQTLGSASANVTFSSIPQGYTDLVLVVQAKAATTDDNIYLRFNSDNGSNYSVTSLYGNGSTAASARYSSSYIWFDNFGYLRTSDFSTIVMNFQNYSNSTTNKTCLIRNNIASVGVSVSAGLWRNTAPITAINLLTSGFATGSTFSLYGIAGGGFTAKASGGIVTTDATYAYHTFTTSGAFTPSQALTVDYLVVAGGGGGAAGDGGGGGAGGMRCTVTGTGGSGSLETALSLSSGLSYPVIIGAGGAGGLETTFASSGNNSVFGSITSTGGGRSGGPSYAPLTGGSGGGGGFDNGGAFYVGATGTSGQGFAGGNGAIFGASNAGGGGGGGASAVGGNAVSPNAGSGGAGRATSISGTSVTYAGGGGGGSHPNANPGTGGAGGGGNGGDDQVGVATSGTANLGGGGGGGAESNTISKTGGNGGSGVVIIRYAI
jgi:hypothetical protein